MFNYLANFARSQQKLNAETIFITKRLSDYESSLDPVAAFSFYENISYEEKIKILSFVIEALRDKDNRLEQELGE